MIWYLIVAVWGILSLLFIMFIHGANIKNKKYETCELCVNRSGTKNESKEKVGSETSPMKPYLIKVVDKNKIKDFESLGFITYVSLYTNLIGFECRENMVHILETHPNVISVEEAATGSLLCKLGANETWDSQIQN